MTNVTERTRRTVLQGACQLAALFCVLGAVLGCSRRYSDLPAYWPIPISDYSNKSVGRFKSSYLAEQIDSYYRGVNPGPIGVTTFVNLDELNSTSSFGRMYAEQLMSELSERGYDVVELRQADALQFIGSSGEFGLSREPGFTRRQHDLGAVVVGTYVVSPIRVYVNARLVDPSSAMVLSAGSVEMEKTEEIARMLRGGAFAQTLERIPVRHLGFASYPMSDYNNTQGRLYDMEESGGAVHAGKAPPAPTFVEPRILGGSEKGKK